MFVSVAVLFAMVSLALAAPPAQSTYCYEDNLLRAFQHSPTPASKYCATATGNPTFVPSTYPATRLSSACSCFSRIPVEGATPTPTPTPTPPCTASNFQVTLSGSVTNMVLTIFIDRAQSCGSGYKVINTCGTFNGNTLVYNPAENYDGPDYCFDPTSTTPIDSNGIDYEYVDGQGSHMSNLFLSSAGPLYTYVVFALQSYYFSSITYTCGTTAVC